MSLAGSVISPQCAQTLLVDLDIFNAACLKLALSKGLGIAIILGAVICKSFMSEFASFCVQILNCISRVASSADSLLQ